MNMGGKCYFGDDKKVAPNCTDNFQIVQGRFTSHGYKWYSVEQAFQALKFPEESNGRTEIYNLAPQNGETNERYGMRVWIYGSRRPSTGHPKWIMRIDWDKEKIKAMYILNLNKYASNLSFQRELVNVTKRHQIIGKASTDSKRYDKNWSFWNGAIQMIIREKILQKKDLNQEAAEVMKQTGKDVENMLLGVE